MTGRVDLPSEPRVRAVLARLRQRATGSAERLTVLALAREFGLSNSTFRRHFLDVAQDIAEASRSGPPAAGTPTSRYGLLLARNAKFKRRNRELAAQLTLAAARIQQITLDNHGLRQQLEAVSGVPRIGAQTNRTRGRPSVPSPPP
ncbi:hypothetical protein [Streptomyces sp. NBC_00827]|uniref:hypothetical protein n=1 Tax=Streptomyces sp. NBC_00827 TaxID=2903677 RepID=UPI00386F7D78|nr:hypothetical protein OG569_08235 [Streptomyces sp. NBC_00827]